MRPIRLRRVLRGATSEALGQVLTLAPESVRIEDANGTVLLAGSGVSDESEYEEIELDGLVVGRVVGGKSTSKVADLVRWMLAREAEKRGLAAETLGRYKELSLLYDMGEKLSRQLELTDVARAVLEDAQRHLGATAGALYLHDPGRNVLEVVSWVGDRDVRLSLRADQGVAGQVLETGRAVFIGDEGGDPMASIDAGPTSLICAPLRVGDRVFGVLRIWQEGDVVWTSGDLKLVAALAANASSAVSAAQLHSQRVRQMALLHQLERHVSAGLLQACYGDEVPEEDDLVVACCDLRTLASVKGAGEVEHVVRAVEGGSARVISVFLSAGATVDTPQGLVLGLFTGAGAAEVAVRAAQRAIEEVADFAPTGLGLVAPGVGIASAQIRQRSAEGLNAGINTAAVLQSDSDGRLLVDARVRQALDSVALVSLGQRELPSGKAEIFEVMR